MEDEKRATPRGGRGNTGDATPQLDKKPLASDLKIDSNPDQDLEIGDGHLVELEVDLNRVLVADEGVEGDYAADTSPFPAVRAVVPETDDQYMPVNTFRAWFLGIVSYRPTCALTQKQFACYAKPVIRWALPTTCLFNHH